MVAATPLSASYEQCRICESQAHFVGEKRGPLAPGRFEIWACDECGYGFVANPWRDYERIYDEGYYRGDGADPMVDYVFELEHPEFTIRQYEWCGVLKTVSGLVPVGPQTRWLDFGCGNGGLVRYVRQYTECHRVVGYETGRIKEHAAGLGVPFVSDAELDQQAGTFDIVSAIEVIEHIPEPLDALRKMRRLLRPGGLLFVTTGNAEPYRGRLVAWPYVNPTIHVSFFEPRTLAYAMEASGFRPEVGGRGAGFKEIVQFKVLKNLRMRRKSAWQGCLPWTAAARLIDARLGLSRMPIGWAV